MLSVISNTDNNNSSVRAKNVTIRLYGYKYEEFFFAFDLLFIYMITAINIR